MISKMRSPEEKKPSEEPSPPIGRKYSGLAVSFVVPSPKKAIVEATQFIDEDVFINERKPSNTMVKKYT
jgi:hypothetical protein